MTTVEPSIFRAYVWVATERDYDDTTIHGVATSLDEAVDMMIRVYGDPYVVEWSEPEMDEGDDFAMLHARFAHVPDLCTEHNTSIVIERLPLTGCLNVEEVES